MYTQTKVMMELHLKEFHKRTEHQLTMHSRIAALRLLGLPEALRESEIGRTTLRT